MLLAYLIKKNWVAKLEDDQLSHLSCRGFAMYLDSPSISTVNNQPNKDCVFVGYSIFFHN
jgi:hypothetical protein